MNELSLADMVGAGHPQPPRRSRRTSERRKKKRRRRTWLSVLIALVVIGGAVGGAWVGLRSMISQFNQPTDYAGPGEGSVPVRVPDGASGTAIGQLLVEKGVVLSVKGFVDAFGQNPNSAGIQPGTYTLKLRMRSVDVVAALLDDANRMQWRVTLKEGVRAATVPALVAGKTKIPLADLQAALKNTAGIGLPPEAKGNAEGWLFPATYVVDPETTALDLVKQMVQRTVDELDSLNVPAAQRQALLIKASLVQAEAKLAVDFPKIARVIDNRLAVGRPLQLDTTVHYATGKFTVATSLKDTQIDSPYNTYRVKALPIGPIDNPGTLALKSVISPTPGPWLFFVATNPQTGATEYGVTEADHAALQAKSDAWTRAHPGQ